MTSPGWKFALAALVVLSTACTTTPAPTPDASFSLRGQVHLEVTPNGVTTGVPATRAAGQPLDLYVQAAGWTHTSVISTPPVATATVADDLSYTLKAPGTLEDHLTSPLSEFWPVPELSGSNWTCARQLEEVRPADLRFAMGVTRLRGGGAVPKDVDLIFKSDAVATPQTYDLVQRGLMYVNQPGTVTLSYDCTSIYHWRRVIDVQLELQRGWNLLEFRATQASSTDPQLTTTMNEVRVRPMESFPKDLYWYGETLNF